MKALGTEWRKMIAISSGTERALMTVFAVACLRCREDARSQSSV